MDMVVVHITKASIFYPGLQSSNFLLIRRAPSRCVCSSELCYKLD